MEVYKIEPDPEPGWFIFHVRLGDKTATYRSCNDPTPEQEDAERILSGE